MTVFSLDLDTIEVEDIYHVSGKMLTLTGAILWPIAGISYFIERAVSGDFFFYRRNDDAFWSFSFDWWNPDAASLTILILASVFRRVLD